MHAVVEKDFSAIPFKNFRWIQGIVTSIDPQHKTLQVNACDAPENGDRDALHTDDRSHQSNSPLEQGKQQQQHHQYSTLETSKQHPLPTTTQYNRITYDKACICTGARPRRLLDSPHVHVIRDTESLQTLSSKLKTSKRVVVVGNGGIALELAYHLRDIDVVWVVKHKHIGDAFFDADAAEFLLEELVKHNKHEKEEVHHPQRLSQPHGHPTRHDGHRLEESASLGKKAAGIESYTDLPGHAVGPRWAGTLGLSTAQRGVNENVGPGSNTLHIECKCDVVSIMPSRTDEIFNNSSEYKYSVGLSDGRFVQTDLIISAIGVDPGASLRWVPPSVQRGKENALLVNDRMETSVPDVYAAGDACCARWAEERSAHWFQMRLWSQARCMAVYAAHCMCGVYDQRGADMAFEVFTHVTRFLGKKVVFLGLYNGQRLENEPERDMVSYSRIMDPLEPEGRTFVRILLLRGRVQGAVMIGDTDLEETMENLIMDGLDVSRYGAELLDPDVELDHVFD